MGRWPRRQASSAAPAERHALPTRSLALNAAQVAGAVSAGALYGQRPAYAFFAATAVSLVSVAASLVIRRGRRLA